MTSMTWGEAIFAILAAEGAALPCATIAERITAQGLRRPVANPTAAVRSVLGSSVRRCPSRFRRTAKGEYMLLGGTHHQVATPVPPSPSEGNGIEDTEEGAIQALEMTIAALDAFEAELVEAMELPVNAKGVVGL